MFGIRINMEDELSSGMYRNNYNQPKNVNIICTVSVIEANGFSFKQALKLLNEVLPRRELDLVYQENCFRINREQILQIAKKHGIELSE